MKLERESWGTCRIDEETGRKYWELGGEGWKDGSSLEPGECATFNPETFEVGERIEVLVRSNIEGRSGTAPNSAKPKPRKRSKAA